jgi:hypothetical protein
MVGYDCWLGWDRFGWLDMITGWVGIGLDGWI